MNPTKRMRVAAVTAGAGGLLLLMGAMGAGAQDPPGDNATIKIDGVDFDSDPGNEPHVDCPFQVDFYNFDEDPDLFAHVVFTAHPPTGSGEILLEDDVFVGEDPADGANEEGIDASETYDLSAALADIEPEPQGWHVRVDIDATDGTSKSKVFWVEQCGVPTTTSSSTTSTSTTSTSTTSTSTSSTSSTTVTTAPGSTTTTMAPGAPTTAGGGVTPHRPAAPPAPAAAPGGQAQLPRTGTSTLPLTVLGAALLAGGAGAGLLARRMAAGEGT